VGPVRRGASGAVERIIQLVRRQSTAAVLFHHAVAERMGLGPADHKCLDLLRERGAMTGSQLAAITGLTTGAVTGVVARLEGAGYLRRKPDADDGRRQILSPSLERMRDFDAVFGPVRTGLAALLESFDARERAAVARFLDGATELTYLYAGQLRAESMGYASVAESREMTPARPRR
jgi:DNA-binding MarR family transcriptional regulator